MVAKARRGRTREYQATASPKRPSRSGSWKRVDAGPASGGSFSRVTRPIRTSRRLGISALQVPPGSELHLRGRAADDDVGAEDRAERGGDLQEVAAHRRHGGGAGPVGLAE